MAFILLLLLSLSTMVQVESRIANMQIETLKARQNALLGAYIALGNLQKSAGPDQRVTATGDILPGTNQNKAKLTGVWDSDPNSTTFGEPIDWLVSRDPSTTFDPTNFNTATPSANSVELVTPRKVGQTDEIPAVLAETVDIIGSNGVAEGSFAWWVGDEGVKASMGLGLPEFAGLSGTELEWVETTVPTRFAVNTLTGLDVVTDPDRWARIFDRSEASNLNDTALFQDAVRDHFHDLTGRSFSVLANVRDGGLKKDLTAGLRSGVTLMEDDLGYDTIFPPQWGGPSDQDPGGARWEQLRDFYNFRVSGTGAGTVNMQEGSNDEISVVPVLTWGQVYVHATQANATGDVVRFYLMPAFALWNPYQHSLSMPASKVGAHLFNPRWKVTDDTANPTTAIARSSFPAPLVWGLPSTTFAPGEVKLFSMNSHQQVPATGVINLTEGWNAGFGMFQDVAVRDETQPVDPITNLHPQVPLTADLQLAFEQATGNGEFYLFDGVGNTLADMQSRAFSRALMFVLWSQSNQWRQINGSLGQIAPGLGNPLVDPAHGSPMPRLGYQFAGKFASAFHNMSWIDAPEESVFLGKYNARSHFSSRSPSDRLSNGGSGAYNTNPLYTSGFQGGNALYSEAGNFATGYAASISDNGLTNAGYFQLLREDVPVVSLGQFMHAELTHTTGFEDTSDPWIFTNYQPSFAIGNSLADPRIPNTETFRNWNDFFGYRTGTHYDQSYLLNDALWDRFYLSAIPREGDPFDGGNNNGQFDQGDVDLGGSLRLPNPQMTLVGTPPVAELAGNDSDPEIDSYSRAAEHLLNKGALNINSTSEAAWKALFTAFIDENVRISTGDQPNNGSSPLTRTVVPVSGPFTSGSPTLDDAHSGYRALSPTEAENLAASLVENIRDRVSDAGRPFLSLSEFVNRSLTSSNVDFRLQGVMQDAIDDSGINDSLATGERIQLTTADGNGLAFRGSDPTGIVPANVDGDKLFGISSYVMAADIFAKFGHMLSPRSDTFVIRSYGQTTNFAGGDNPSAALCELIVQRFPETVDPDDDIQQPSEPFGRSFRVISFRWIDESTL